MMKKIKWLILTVMLLASTAIGQDAYWIIDDHGLLMGLNDDDHFQYMRTDGSRTLTGHQNLGSYNLTNGGSFGGVGPFKNSGSVGLEFQTLQDTWVFKFASGLGSDNSGLFFNLAGIPALEFRALDVTTWKVDVLGRVFQDGDLTIGVGFAQKNYKITFDGEDNDGVFSFKEDTGVFNFDSAVELPGDPTQSNQAATKQYVDNASPTVSLLTIYTIPAGAMILTHDAAFAPVETLTGSNISRFAHTFDYSTTEYGRVELIIPSDLDTSGNVTFTFYWRPRVHPNPAQNVVFEIESIAVADGESWDQALASKGTVTGTSKTTANQISMTTSTLSVSTLGWAATDTAVIRISRDADNGDDTLDDAADTDDDVLLMAVKIEIPRE